MFIRTLFGRLLIEKWSLCRSLRRWRTLRRIPSLRPECFPSSRRRLRRGRESGPTRVCSKWPPPTTCQKSRTRNCSWPLRATRTRECRNWPAAADGARSAAQARSRWSWCGGCQGSRTRCSPAKSKLTIKSSETNFNNLWFNLTNTQLCYRSTP